MKRSDARIALSVLALGGCFIKPNPAGTGDGGSNRGSDIDAPGAPSDTAPTFNIVFVTSNAVNLDAMDGSNNFGRAAMECSNEARDANLTGAFVPWLSTLGMPATSEILRTGATGWTRPDGAPVLGSILDLNQGAILHAISENASGSALDLGTVVLTSTLVTGNGSGSSCLDGAAPSATSGDIYSTTTRWTNNGSVVPCNLPQHVYCFGTSKQGMLSVPASAERKVFVSKNAFKPNDTTIPDDVCKMDAGSVHALISTSSHAASSTVSGGTYVRPDGTIVTRDNFAHLLSSINQQYDGTYVDRDVWLGGASFTSAPVVGKSCTDWTNGTGSNGVTMNSTETFTPPRTANSACSIARAVLCVENN